MIKITGSAIAATRAPTLCEATTNCEVSSSATDDIGTSATPTHSDCRSDSPLAGPVSSRLSSLAAMRAATSASAAQVKAPCQSACAAIKDTSTNISTLSMAAAVPSWRGQTQGRGCSCLSTMPASSVASGAEPLAWLDSRVRPVLARNPVPLAVFPPNGLYRLEMTHALDAMGKPWRIAYVSSSLPGVSAAAEGGLGLTLLALAAAEADTHPELRTLRVRAHDHMKPARALYARAGLKHCRSVVTYMKEGDEDV